jgi:hypothetical protein
MGYVVELNSRYALVTLPSVVGCPTGILNLDLTKALAPLTYMQSLPVVAKGVTGGRTTLTLSPDPLLHAVLALPQFTESRQVGEVITATITLLKEYGAVA